MCLLEIGRQQNLHPFWRRDPPVWAGSKRPRALTTKTQQELNSVDCWQETLINRTLKPLPVSITSTPTVNLRA
jgi:hypothetical protein